MCNMTSHPSISVGRCVRVSSRFIRKLCKTTAFLVALCILCVPCALALGVHLSADLKRFNAAGTFGSLPLSFEQNQGQADSQVRFLSRRAGFSAFFKENEADFVLARQSTGRESTSQALVRENAGQHGGPSTADLLRMRLLNANSATTLSGTDRLPGAVNYFVGSDPANWHTGLPTFAQLKYAGVYPGIDLVYHGSGGRLEFDFQVAPGANANAIQFRFEGARKLKLDRQGNLVIIASNGDISFQKPVVYQSAGNGDSESIAGSFRISAGNTVHFAIGRYDHAKPLIIDPILNYSTHIGQYAGGTAIAVDSAGEAYITGYADLDFPTTPGSYQPIAVTTTDADGYPAGGRIFVARLNSTGTAILYATYLSGSGLESSYGIALYASGDAFVVGTTSSTNFPVTTGALQTTNKASSGTGFITALNSTGSALLYSTYLGGSTLTSVNNLTIDVSGDAYITGSTQDTDFPTTSGAFQTSAKTKTSAGFYSAFVAKLNPAGSALIYSTLLGRSGQDFSSSVAVDNSGAAYLGGSTSSSDFPITQGAFQQSREASNYQAGFVAKLNAAGSALVYSTYLGGEADDGVSSIALDSTGDVYAAGDTDSPDFPITAGAFQPNIGYNGFNYPQTNAFVSKFNSTGSALVYSTFLGENSGLNLADQGDEARSIAVDGQGNAFLTGIACTIDFPITAGALEPQNLSMETSFDCAGFVSKFNPTATLLLYSTYFSGTGGQQGSDSVGDGANGLALDSSGNVYVTGFTSSVDFPTTAATLPGGLTGGGFVSQFNGSEMQRLPIPTVTLTSSPSPVEFGQPVTFTATVQPFGSIPTPTGTVGFSFEGLEANDADGTGVGMDPWTTVSLNSSGVATFTTSSFSGIQITVIAHYLGDANNAPNTGTMTQILTAVPTVATLISSENSVPYGTPVTFTASSSK
jgi:hypothetical protein